MSGSIGGNKSKSNTGPWVGQQPFLTDVFGQAQNLYNQGVPGYYPGATYTPFNDIQQNAMGLQEQRALAGSPSESALSGYLTNSLQQPQFDLTQAGMGANQAASGVGMGQYGLANAGGPGLAGGAGYSRFGANSFESSYLPNLDQLQGSQNYVNQLLAENPTLSGRIGDVNAQVNTALDPTAGQTLRNTAQGQFLNNNPFLDDQFKRASENVRQQFNESVIPGLNATFGKGGRTGSAIHGQVMNRAGEDLGDTLSNLATGIYGNDYARERQNQLQAANQLGGLGLQSGGLGIQAAGLGADVYKNDAARQLGAAGLGSEMFNARSNDALGRLSANTAQNQLGADLYNQGQNRSLQAAQALLSGGISGVNAMGNLYGQVGANQIGAASMVPDLTNLQYGNIDRLRSVGNDVQGLSDRALQDEINRFNYYQQAPQDLLRQYSDIIQAMQIGQSKNKGSGFNVGVS